MVSVELVVTMFVIVGAEGAVGALETVPVNCRVADPWLLVVVTVKSYAPGVVGVPVMAPVEVLRVSPAGSVPALTEYVGVGFPLALIPSE